MSIDKPRKRTVPSHALTPPMFAKRYAISPEKVLRWIELGQLRAYNVALDVRGGKRWVIPFEAIDEFFASRSNAPAVEKQRRGKRRQAGTVEYV